MAERIKKAIEDRIKSLEQDRFTDDWDESSAAHVSGLKDALRIIDETAPELRQSLADVLTLARLKWGNLDADANKVFKHAEALLAQTAT